MGGCDPGRATADRQRALSGLGVRGAVRAERARWFSDRDFTRIHHSRGPISRVYATVLEPGTVTTGDRVVLEP